MFLPWGCLLYGMGYGLYDKASICVFGANHHDTCVLLATSFYQGWSGNEDVQVVPNSLFVYVLGQDNRIPYHRPAKHSLSLER